MKSWTIVEFLQDGTVDAVPSLWVIGDYCHWPLLSTSRMMKAMKACEGVNKCWPKHAIKHFKNGTFDDYAKARAKAKVAEETSDLQSEVELGPKRRRKIVRMVSDTDEESESMMPTPPALKHCNELGTNSTTEHHTDFDQLLPTHRGQTHRNEPGTSSTTVHQTDFDQLLPTHRGQTHCNEPGTSSTTVHQTDFDQLLPTPRVLTHCNEPGRSSTTESVQVLHTPPKMKRRNDLGRSSTTESVQVLHTPPTMKRRNDLGTCSRLVDQIDECDQISTNYTITEEGQTHRYLKMILQQQHLLRCLMTDVSTRVEKIERILEKNPQQCSSTDQQKSSVFLHISCPVNSQEEFDELDTFLRDGENAKNVAFELASIGGANCASFIKRTLGSLMTNELAMEFSWLGKKGKRRFEATKLATVIIDAAKISKVSTSVNDTEVCMQKWLRRAAERTRVINKVY